MEMNTWDIENIEAKILEDEKKINDKNNLNYDDNYFQQNNYYAFNAVGSLLACGLDYSDKNMPKMDSVETLKEKMKNEYDISFISSLDQRLNHVTFQHPNTR